MDISFENTTYKMYYNEINTKTSEEVDDEGVELETSSTIQGVMVVDGVTVYTFEFDYEIAYQDFEGNYECSVYKISVGFSLSEDYTYESVVVSSSKYMAEAVLSETESEDEEPELLYIEHTLVVVRQVVRVAHIARNTTTRVADFAHQRFLSERRV